MAVTTWDPVNISGCSLSGGNLTATATGGGTLNSVISTNRVTSGKYYWELIVTTVTSDRYGIQNLSRGTFLGGDTNGVGWGQDNTVYFNNSQVATWLTFASGDKIQFCLDVGGKLLWGNKNNATGTGTPGSGSGGWNNNNGNPATGVGGLSISSFNGIGSTALGAGGMPFTASDVVTGVFSTASWSFTPPSGFITFDPAPTGSLLLTNRGTQNTGMDRGSGTIRG